MKKIVKFLLLFSWFVLIQLPVGSQVTIGSDKIDPVKGALLDLKEFTSADSTTATTGGLLLARVKLVKQNTLEPFIQENDAEWQTRETQTRIDHIGLLVFNLANHASFHPGFYVWNGKEWKALVMGDDVLQLPAFPLKWSNASVDLFEVYKNNFTSGSTGYFSSKGGKVAFPNPVSKAEDFHYLIAGYNSNLFNINGISSDGVLTYTAIGSTAPLPEESYINIILVKKNK